MSDQTDFTFFDNKQAEECIRHVWHGNRWYFSMIDVVGFLTESKQLRVYWAQMKYCPAEDGGFSELFTSCEQLKMTAPDGKRRLADAAYGDLKPCSSYMA